MKKSKMDQNNILICLKNLKSNIKKYKEFHFDISTKSKEKDFIEKRNSLEEELNKDYGKIKDLLKKISYGNLIEKFESVLTPKTWIQDKNNFQKSFQKLETLQHKKRADIDDIIALINQILGKIEILSEKEYEKFINGEEKGRIGKHIINAGGDIIISGNKNSNNNNNSQTESKKKNRFERNQGLVSARGIAIGIITAMMIYILQSQQHS